MRRISVILLPLFLLSMSEASADVVIIVRRQAETTGNYVRICDIARVDGPKEQVTEVASVILGPAPSKGEIREISRRDIEIRLFEMGIGAPVSFDGNEMVRVFGNGIRPENRSETEVFPLATLAPLQVFPGDGSAATPVSQARPLKKPDEAPLESMSAEGRERLSSLISGYLSGQYSRSDIEVSAKLIALSDFIPFSAREITVEKADGRLPGKATLQLKVRETPDSEPRQVLVSAEAGVFGLAPVAARNLARGEVLARNDVRIARIPMESGRAYLPPRPEAAAGRELSRSIAAGEPILAGDAVPAQAVRRGEAVQSVTRDRAWEIKGNGKALSGGMVGDVVTVEDSSTKVKYQARIIDRGVVSVLPKRMN